MRALTRGERIGSVGVVLGLFGVICLLAVSVGLNIKHANDLDELKSTIVGRCEQRHKLDMANHDAVQANVQFYRALEAIAAENPIPEGTDPRIVRLYERQKAAIAKAAAESSAAAQAGVVGPCSVYR